MDQKPQYTFGTYTVKITVDKEVYSEMDDSQLDLVSEEVNENVLFNLERELNQLVKQYLPKGFNGEVVY